MYLFGKALRRKKLVYALCELYGIGYFRSREICGKLNLSEETLLSELRDSEVSRLMDILNNQYEIESTLRKINRAFIIDLVQIRCYRGIRHLRNLPVRGQRTHTNARTQRKLGRYRWRQRRRYS